MDSSTVELCPRCRASIAMTSYALPFEGHFARAYCNPSSTDRAAIESRLSDPIAELTTLVDEIQRTELFLDALKTHRAHLETHIHRTTRFIQFSPIRQLPTEILGLIFASACSSCQEDEYKTPLSISLVCSKWRHIAISTPTLWTNIYVAQYSSARGLPVYQYFLQQCGMIPISVKVEVPAVDHPYKEDDYYAFVPFEESYQHHVDVMGDVYASFAQWKHAEFHMKQADILLLDEVEDRWRPQMDSPILESLTLAIKDASDASSLPNIFWFASFLSSVNIIDCCQSQKLLWIDGLPWEQIRHVQTDLWDTGNLRYMHHNTDFQDDLARIIVLDGSLSTSRCMFSHTNPLSISITTLILDRPWTHSLCIFLHDVSIRNLEDLTIISRDPKDTFPGCFNPLLSLPLFLEHGNRRLNAFSLIMHGWYDEVKWERTIADSLVDVLHDMDNLKSLQVIESNMAPPLLSKRIFEELSADVILPELTSLELVWAENHQPDEELFSVLSSRGDGRLSSVVLGMRNEGNLGPDVLECMQVLVVFISILNGRLEVAAKLKL